MMNAIRALVRWFWAEEPTPSSDSEQSTHSQQQQKLVDSLRGGQCIFLDFDGVLHRGNSGTLVLLPKLEALLRKHPQIVIVISSTWRNGGLRSSASSLRLALNASWT